MNLQYRFVAGVVCGSLAAMSGCGSTPADTDTTASSSSGSTGGGVNTGTSGPEPTTSPTTSPTTLPTTVDPTASSTTLPTTSSASDPTDSGPGTDSVTVATITTVGTETGDTDTDGTTGPVQMFTPLALEVEDFDADGAQDLLVHILAKSRYAVANYPNVTVPTNIEVKEAARDNFGSFYVSLFDATAHRRWQEIVIDGIGTFAVDETNRVAGCVELAPTFDVTTGAAVAR